MSTGLFGNYYAGKRVLVTGHTGFKGSWLVLWLSRLGARVSGFSIDLPSTPCHFEVAGLQELIQHHNGDVRNFDQLKRVFDDFQPEVVFHLAAQSLVRRSFDEPKVTFDTNAGGTVALLECLRLCESVRTAVLITSDKCYRNVEWVWGYRENDLLGGEDPYSASKACAELAIHCYSEAFFKRTQPLRLASTRAGNVIGGGDWAADRIIPDCVKAWSKQQEIAIRNPKATRPWQFVLEPLSGYLWLGACLGNGLIESGEAFNFGPGDRVIQPVADLIEAFRHYWGSALYRIVPPDAEKKENSLLKLCCDKALSKLNWRAILTFDETVALTALWYKRYYKQEGDMRAFSESQIEHYSSLAKERGLTWAMCQ
jgi:CDP-glucose 4,6-dehydratase